VSDVIFEISILGYSPFSQFQSRDPSVKRTLQLLLVCLGFAYCGQQNWMLDYSARVAYINVERQLKLRGIPFTHVNPTNDDPVAMELTHIQSTFARSVPALCVQSKDILSGAPAAEAAMPNIRVIPLNWWSEKNAQVCDPFRNSPAG
jgi:hypothetical protein